MPVHLIFTGQLAGPRTIELLLLKEKLQGIFAGETSDARLQKYTEVISFCRRHVSSPTRMLLISEEDIISND